MTFDDFDLKYRALKLFLFLQLMLKVGLAQIGNESNEIWETLTGDGTGGHQADI